MQVRIAKSGKHHQLYQPFYIIDTRCSELAHAFVLSEHISSMHQSLQLFGLYLLLRSLKPQYNSELDSLRTTISGMPTFNTTNCRSHKLW